MQGFRAFVAVPVEPGAPLLALLDGLRATGADLKVVPPGNLHVTLKFIGDLDAARAADVEAAMREASRDAAPFEARLEGVGAFGPARAPRVVWVGMRGAEGLARVADALDTRLAAMGVAERERRAFQAHVTLARARSPRGADAVARFVKAHERADAGPVAVEATVLMRSDLGPDGPTYTPVARIPMGAA